MSEYQQYLQAGLYAGCSCAACFKPITAQDLALDCPDCAAVFCADCVENGTFEGHFCEDFEFEE